MRVLAERYIRLHKLHRDERRLHLHLVNEGAHSHDHPLLMETTAFG